MCPRRRHLPTLCSAQVDAWLRLHHTALKALYEVFRAGEESVEERGALSFGGWGAFCLECGVMDNAFSQRDVVKCFTRWERGQVRPAARDGWGVVGGRTSLGHTCFA